MRLRYLDGTHAVVKFFGSRLKWSRWAAVDLVAGEDSETLVRTVAEHFVRFGGVPLCAVFDRPKTVALKWPPAWRGHTVWARYAGPLLRLFDDQTRLIRQYVVEPGKRLYWVDDDVPLEVRQPVTGCSDACESRPR